MKYAQLPLHPGKAPPWLFSRMREMAGIIAEWIIDEHGAPVLLERLASPYWFQAFACVLGFDWHSSGTTTTALAALREGYKGEDISVLGGKGKLSTRLAEQLKGTGHEERVKLVHSVFGKAIDDGYSIYFASVVSTDKDFVVIDQGMNDALGYARRYHWHNSFELYRNHENIAGYEGPTLNTVSPNINETRKVMLDLIKDNYVIRALNGVKGQRTLFDDNLDLPSRHVILKTDLNERDIKIFSKLYEYQPGSYEEVLTFSGMGPKKIRALALTANLVYGSELDWKDPIKYSFAVGGKDGIPFPVDKPIYDENIEMLRTAVEEGKMRENEKRRALKALGTFSD